jgi:hypothetical protein
MRYRRPFREDDHDAFDDRPYESAGPRDFPRDESRYRETFGAGHWDPRLRERSGAGYGRGPEARYRDSYAAFEEEQRNVGFDERHDSRYDRHDEARFAGRRPFDRPAQTIGESSERWRGVPRAGAYGGGGDFGREAFGARGGRDDDAGSRGGHAGKGPRGYQRSDERIREDVCDALTVHDEVDARDIEVEVRDGEVTLSGFVPDRTMKYLAEQLCERVVGVRDVHNRIRHRRETEHGRDPGTTTLHGLGGDRDQDGRRGLANGRVDDAKSGGSR